MGFWSEVGAAIGIASAITSAATGAAAHQADKAERDYARAKASEERSVRERWQDVETRAANEPKSGGK